MSEEFLGIPDLEVIKDDFASQGLSSLNPVLTEQGQLGFGPGSSLEEIRQAIGDERFLGVPSLPDNQEFGQPLIPVPQFERPEDFRDFVSQNRLFGGLQERDGVTGQLNVFGEFIPDPLFPELTGAEQAQLDEFENVRRRNRRFNEELDARGGRDILAPLPSREQFEQGLERSLLFQANRIADQRRQDEIDDALILADTEFRAAQQPSDVIFGGEDTSDFLIGDTGDDNLTLGSFRNPANPFAPPNLREVQRFIRGKEEAPREEAPREEAPREEAPTPSFLQQLFRNIFLTGQKKEEREGLPSLLDRLANFNLISPAMAGELPRTPIPLRAGVFSDFDAINRNPPLTPREQRKRAGAQATEEIRQAVGPEIYDERQRQRRNDPALQAARERFLRENQRRKKGGQVLKGRAMRSTNYNHQKFI
tara:strand:- start:273 stop:1538 length:1266 start_codon:yes stop_codon:yes gene_type:complete